MPRCVVLLAAIFIGLPWGAEPCEAAAPVIGTVPNIDSAATPPMPFIGVTLNARFTAEAAQKLGLKRRTGAHVLRLTPGGPAEEAKIQVDDVILKFNGIDIDDNEHLVKEIKKTRVAGGIPIVLFRKGQTLNMKTAVRDYKKFQKEAAKK
jgi:S1-C subfamily serine protease